MAFGTILAGLYLLAMCMGSCGFVCNSECLFILTYCTAILMAITNLVQLTMAYKTSVSQEANACLAANLPSDSPDLSNYQINAGVIAVLKLVPILQLVLVGIILVLAFVSMCILKVPFRVENDDEGPVLTVEEIKKYSSSMTERKQPDDSEGQYMIANSEYG